METNNKIPLMYILMSNKSYQLYYCIFEYIQKLLILENIDVNFKKIIFTADFERGLRKALIDSFPNSEILGCYFHMIKALWIKAKKYKLCKKALFKETIILIFSFKIYPYIPKDQRDDYINQIENNFKSKPNFERLIIYFKKNWAKTNFLDFHLLIIRQQLKELITHVKFSIEIL